MNYLDNYLNYTTGKNRKILFKIHHDFLENIRNENCEEIKKLFDEKCIADISMIGKNIQGSDNICKALFFPVSDVNLRKIHATNISTRTHNGKAQQVSSIQCIFGYEDEKNVYPFCFGGQLIISYKLIDNVWKMTHIKFDLAYESGNNALVADSWILMDYGIYNGHDTMINPLFDSPWRVIPKDDEDMSEVEQVIDSMNRINFDTDTGDWSDYKFVLANGFIADLSARGNASKENSSTDSKMTDLPYAINWIRGKFHKEPRLQHVGIVIDVTINDDTGEAYYRDYRSEFNRLYNNIYDKENIHTIALTCVHDNVLVKENGIWKLKSSLFLPHQDFRYVDDDCIEYDDMICGGIK